MNSKLEEEIAALRRIKEYWPQSKPGKTYYTWGCVLSKKNGTYCMYPNYCFSDSIEYIQFKHKKERVFSVSEEELVKYGEIYQIEPNQFKLKYTGIEDYYTQEIETQLLETK